MRAGQSLALVTAIAATSVFAAGCGADDESIALLHAITGEEEIAALQAALDAFEDATGYRVAAEASPDFEVVIATRVEGNNPPDVALYPQPGLLSRMASRDLVLPLADVGIDAPALTGELVEGMVEAATFDGTAYGVVVKLGLKSLLWYPRQAFDEAGYQPPQSWDELEALTELIASDLAGEPGRAPWCVGIESGSATGWIATDWIEDLMLRLHGRQVYQRWMSGELPFASPEVREAFERLESLWLDERFVLGGVNGILLTPEGEAAAPMFTEPAGCFLHRQAGYIESTFPADAQFGVDYDVVYLPAVDEAAGRPALFAGDVAAVHTDTPGAAELVTFLTSLEAQQAWMGHPGAGSLSVRVDFPPTAYPSESLGAQGEILAAATDTAFDASDVMPVEVGLAAFWSEAVAWIGGQDLDTTLRNIDAAWPR